MFKKILFLIIFSFNLNAEQTLDLEQQKDLNFLLEKKGLNFNAVNINDLYIDFKSREYITQFSENFTLKVVFNEDFDSIDLSLYDKNYILNNKNKNFFLPPNIIHLSSMHNKSFAFSIYKDNLYEGVVKQYIQQILFFHEVSHFFLEHNINFSNEFAPFKLKEYKFKNKIEESFSDLYGLLLLSKYYNLSLKETLEIFKVMIHYRNKYINFSYKGNQLLENYLSNLEENFEKIMKKNDIELGLEIFEFSKNNI